MDKALSFLPDIIISDVMMPVMDGIELCRQIKSTELTSHIPIVLLTAKSSDESEMIGLDVGADDYIIKPFNLQNLKARVENLLTARKRLQEKFSQQLRLEPTSVVLESMDEEFIRRALVIVTDNLGDPDFSIDSFSREMGVSRSQLQRKIKGLTSETPMEFIKSIRLKRAAQLLRDSQLSITEICYQVGFNYPAHFSQQFQKQFGQTPKSYRTQS
jgi:YesN/AraC family two-component response regulator